MTPRRLDSARVALTLALCAGLACHSRPPALSPSRIARHAELDVAWAALDAETVRWPASRRRGYLRLLDEEAARIRAEAGTGATDAARLAALDRRFFGPEGFAAIQDLYGPESISLASTLDHRRGTCVGLAIVYIAIAQRLGLEARGVATPIHLFVRARAAGRVRNIELLESGREIDDDTYRRRYRIGPLSMASGSFMRPLAAREVVAHLIANQGASLSRQGSVDAALERNDAALMLAPRLVAAWYNRGIDLMKMGRLDGALESFNRAIGLHPADAQAHNNRGLTRLRLGDLEGARADFTRALELEPALAEAEENLRKLIGPAPPASSRP